MKTFFSDLIPKIKKFSEKLDDLTLIKNQQWVLINDIKELKTTYIFRDGGTLLIAENGVVSKAKWEYLNSDSLLIESGSNTFLMQQSFKNEDVLVMNMDGDRNYAFFVNESKYKGSINNIDDLTRYLEIKFLQKTYLSPDNRFCYMEFYKEYGPYTADQLIERMNRKLVNPQCFVRPLTEKDYSGGIRIRDLANMKNL